MTRPLIITDCDEVLLHMVTPFAAWLAADHGVTFRMENANFAGALRRTACGTPLEPAEIWPLLDGFFTSEMHRQTAIPGAIDALNQLQERADVVVLTNVGPEHQARRTAQLASHGLDCPVIGSRGGKGDPVAQLIAERRPPLTLFIDDLPQHHDHVAAKASAVWRLHMVGEPAIADIVGTTDHAHARIDAWDAALRWIGARLDDGAPAPPTPLARAA